MFCVRKEVAILKLIKTYFIAHTTLNDNEKIM